MNKVKALILDDEELSTQALEMEIKAFCPFLEIVGIYHDPRIALKEFNSKNADILFLDVEMPWLNGFEFLKCLGPIDCKIIFTTAYNEFAIKAFRTNAIDYLLKPIEGPELKVATMRAMENISLLQQAKQLEAIIHSKAASNKSNTLSIPTRHGFEFIEISEIIYCQSDSNYCIIHTTTEKPKLVSRTLKHIMRQLDEAQFLRIHQSYLINLDMVKAYSRLEGGSISMKNGEVLPISRSKKEGVVERLKGG